MIELITADLVTLDADLGSTSSEVIAHLTGLVVAAGRADDQAGLQADAMAREGQSATGLPGGIGIPHCRSEHVLVPTLAFARLAPRVDFGAPDGPADLVFLIAAPAGGDATHLTLLTALARSLVRPDFVASLRAAATPEEVVALVGEAVEPASAPVTAPAASEPSSAAAAADGSLAADPSAADPAAAGRPGGTLPAPSVGPVIVAVTACPTGIAHTYLAADSLAAAAERSGVTLHVETQGSAAAKPLGDDVVRGADAVIFATDVGVRDRARFAGKPVVASSVKRAINEPDKMIAEALAAANDPNAPRVAGDATAPSSSGSGSSDVHLGIRLRQWLLTGVSYMIPFVAAGGLLIALGFLLAGYEIAFNADEVLGAATITNLPDVPSGLEGGPPFDSALLYYLGAVLFKIGGLAFGFLVPALAGYIAYAIADRPGIAPGFTLGAIASFIGAGFLGGLVGGLLAGLVALWVSRWRAPTWGRGLMPVVVIPLVATLAAGVVMFVVLGKPLANANSGLSDWLTGLTGTSAILLGIILGLMMAFDLGGPVNKAAYTFATAGLGAATAGSSDKPLVIMATVMAAGMVPPLGLALATALRRRLFSEAERENGKASWLLGASFISEGAIPFAAADPFRVIPPAMIGSAVTGAIIMSSGATLRAPHGGIFVFFAMGEPLVFFLALAIGTVITGVLVVALKQLRGRSDAELEAVAA